MDRTISSVFIAVGILLVLLGLTEAESVALDISEFIEGNSIDASIGLMVTGIVISAIGITGFMQNRQSSFIDKSHR